MPSTKLPPGYSYNKYGTLVGGGAQPTGPGAAPPGGWATPFAPGTFASGSDLPPLYQPGSQSADWFNQFGPPHPAGTASTIPAPSSKIPTRKTSMPTGPYPILTPPNWMGMLPRGGTPTAAPTATGSSPLSPGPVSGYNPAYGGVPSAPNPVGTGADAIAGNLGNLTNLYQLATGTGAASAAGASTQLNTALPGASGALATGLGNTQSLLQGKLDPLTLAQYQEDAAQRGVNIGAPGSPNVDAGYLRALGLGRIGLQQTGLSNLGSLIGMAPTGPKFDPASMEITPAQQQFAQILSNYLAAAPNPASAAAANLSALNSGLGRGGRAGQPVTDPLTTLTAAANAFPAQPSGNIPFGTLGRTGATAPATLQGPLAGAAGGMPAGPADPTEDPTQWMNPTEVQTWNAMPPDQQYEEALMGYPSFTGDQTVTVPGSDQLNYNTDTSGESDLANFYDDAALAY